MSDAGDGPRVAIRTLGCKVNRVESEAIAAALLGRGALVVDEHDAAVVVINTCTVTGEADSKARKAVRHALKAPRHPVVVVTGCLATMDRTGLESLGDRVVVEADKQLVVERVSGLLKLRKETSTTPARTGSAFRTRAMLKVQDGCDAFCTYCIVPYARGVPKSLAPAAVVDEAAGLVSAGVREIVLTGINIGRYSHGDVGLAELIEAVAATGISRLRLSSIEPLDITPALIEVIRATRSFCPHLHVPLQSGSDPVLAGMGRGYTVAEYRERVSAAREAIPGLAVTTDVIAGFPGETAEQAAETLRLCEAMAFSKLHVFRYSKRAGTPAATREDQVPAEESSVRASALRDLGARAAAAFAHGRLGETVEVLVERVDTVASGTAVAEGITPDHLRVRFAADGVRVGQLASVRLERVDGACVHGLSAVREPTA